MAYALIPDGYTLKKVTKAQEAAVNANKRHDDVIALLNNPTTLPILGGMTLLLSLPVLLTVIFKALAKQDLGLPDDPKDLGVDYGIFVKDFAEALFEVGGPIIFPSFGDPGDRAFKGEAKDFYEKYLQGLVSR
jgi:hypothetical protein